jgi:hypothetical protein
MIDLLKDDLFDGLKKLSEQVAIKGLSKKHQQGLK